MKKLLLTGILLLCTVLSFAQAPQGFNYQAVARDAAGAALTNQTVQINGDNAWVRHVFDSVNNLPDGKTSTAHIGVLQVWKKHPDGWRLFARQAYLLPKE